MVVLLLRSSFPLVSMQSFLCTSFNLLLTTEVLRVSFSLNAGNVRDNIDINERSSEEELNTSNWLRKYETYFKCKYQWYKISI